MNVIFCFRTPTNGASEVEVAKWENHDDDDTYDKIYKTLSPSRHFSFIGCVYNK
jgi:hypothetical protein